ncbi:MAG: type II secretion system F family protein [Acidimicrobiales bacterium]
MNAIVLAVCGAGVGAGLLIIIRALQPRAIPLQRLALILDRPGVAVAQLTVEPEGHAGVRGAQRHLSAIGLAVMRVVGAAERPKLVDQLRVLDKPLERHAYEKTLAGVAGFALPLFTIVAVNAAGVAVSPLIGLVAAAALGAAGFFYPDLPLAEQVEARRRAFRHAFSSYLDLVTILLAGGAGIETALEGAAEAGDGWAFAEIRRALRRARFTRHSPWEAFEQLGAEIGVDELGELAASVLLAGGHGARIKLSLTAKADALRATQAAELERAAETQTEKMIVPVVVMILGLVLFIAFGAVSAITDNGASTFRPAATQPHTTTGK